MGSSGSAFAMTAPTDIGAELAASLVVHLLLPPLLLLLLLLRLLLQLLDLYRLGATHARTCHLIQQNSSGA